MFDILEVPGHTFENVADPVKTEQNIYELFIDNQQRIPNGFGYVALPLADLINKRGVHYVQYLLDSVEKEYPNFRKVYACQHILVSYLNFYNNIVFTPHTLRDDNKICIPHYNSLVAKDSFVPVSSRKYLYSFVGCFSTHELRSKLSAYDSEHTPIKDTGAWHYQKDQQQKARAQEYYLNVLCNTKFSLSPPGTGVSTIRLFEILAAGSVPVVFNDVKLPKEIDPFCLRTNIVNMQKDIESLVDNLDKNCEAIHTAYWSSLHNDEMFNYILKHVQFFSNK